MEKQHKSSVNRDKALYIDDNAHGPDLEFNADQMLRLQNSYPAGSLGNAVRGCGFDSFAFDVSNPVEGELKMRIVNVTSKFPSAFLNHESYAGQVISGPPKGNVYAKTGLYYFIESPTDLMEFVETDAGEKAIVTFKGSAIRSYPFRTIRSDMYANGMEIKTDDLQSNMAIQGAYNWALGIIRMLSDKDCASALREIKKHTFRKIREMAESGASSLEIEGATGCRNADWLSRFNSDEYDLALEEALPTAGKFDHLKMLAAQILATRDFYMARLAENDEDEIFTFDESASISIAKLPSFGVRLMGNLIALFIIGPFYALKVEAGDADALFDAIREDWDIVYFGESVIKECATNKAGNEFMKKLFHKCFHDALHPPHSFLFGYYTSTRPGVHVALDGHAQVSSKETADMLRTLSAGRAVACARTGLESSIASIASFIADDAVPEILLNNWRQFLVDPATSGFEPSRDLQGAPDSMIDEIKAKLLGWEPVDESSPTFHVDMYYLNTGTPLRYVEPNVLPAFDCIIDAIDGSGTCWAKIIALFDSVCRHSQAATARDDLAFAFTRDIVVEAMFASAYRGTKEMDDARKSID